MEFIYESMLVLLILLQSVHLILMRLYERMTHVATAEMYDMGMGSILLGDIPKGAGTYVC
jgi:hypothetical protein